MTITIEGCLMTGCSIGISAPEGADLNAIGNSFVNCGKALEIREREKETLVESLGFPKNTPPNLIVDALNVLVRYEKSKATERTEKLHRTPLFKFLSATVDLTTIASNLIKIQESGIAQKIIGIFK